MSEQQKMDAERAAFEAWYRQHHGHRDMYEIGADGEYTDKYVQGVFNVWQARASLPVGVPDGYMPIPTAEQLADALENVRCFHDLGAELIAPELLANLLAALSAQQPTPAGDDAERAAFESWMIHVEGSRFASRFDRVTAGPFAGDYRDGQVQGAWNVWQARASLATYNQDT